MKVIQIAFLISFAVVLLMMPFIISTLLEGGTTVIAIVAVIFVINAVLIGRKLLSIRKDASR